MVNKRELQIVSFLLDKDHHIKGEEISSFIGVSSKTLRTDIKSLNQKLKSVNSHIACVKGKGYVLEINNRENFNEKLVSLYEENINNNSFIPTTREGRVSYIIKKLLLLELKYNKGITQAELCDNLFIGLTTLKSDLIIVKKMLKKFDIEVLRDGIKGIALKGSEEKIRSCISYYVFQRYGNDVINLESIEPIFDRNYMEYMEELLVKTINKHEMAITDIGFYNLLIHILIAIKRVKSEHNLAHIAFEDELKDTFEFKVAKEIAEDIYKKFLVMLPHEEIYYMAQHLYTRKAIVSSVHCQNIDFTDENILLVVEILKHIESVIGVDFRHDKALIWSLSTHLKSAIKRIKYDMYITNDMLFEIKKNYSFAYKIASISANYIEKKLKKTINDDEIGFICLHFAAALQRIKNKKGNEKLRVVIVCASGLGTSMIMSAKIKSEFSNSIEIIRVLPLNELSLLDLECYDCIISTIRFDSKDFKVQDKKIIYISPILKAKDINSLKEFVNENKEDYLLKFLEFTDEELFFRDADLKSKEEILNFILDEMVKKKYLKEDHKKYFFKRENISSTEIGNLIAIPHAIDIEPEVSKVCILINKKTILWEEEKVRLVILMSIEKDLYLEFGQILENLHTVLSDKEKVSKLLNISSYKEFIKLVR